MEVGMNKNKPTDVASLPRIGVCICDCGQEIAGSLDTEQLCQRASALPEVVYSQHEAFPCSKDGLARLHRAIEEHQLERILVAGCSPRLVEKLFCYPAQAAGLPNAYVHVTNIREQCAYIHADNPDLALSEAIAALEIGVAHLATTQADVPHQGRVLKSALVIGSGLRGLTVTKGLADSGIATVLLESADSLGGPALDMQESTRQQIALSAEAAQEHPKIETILNAELMAVSGQPGQYNVQIQQGDQILKRSIGAIIVANTTQVKTLGSDQWFDRDRVKTQAEFAHELAGSRNGNGWVDFKDVVMIFCADESQREHCSRVCCNNGIQQASLAKEINPEANVTVFFRDLYLGGLGGASEIELLKAKQAGVTFFRYRENHPPVIGNETIDVMDTLTGEPVRVPYDRVVLSMPLLPHARTPKLASILGLPLDEHGFLAEPRLRLRPGHYAETGIFVLGSAQQPAETSEALFQAYLTSARAARFLSRSQISLDTPVASIDPALCTGCGNCTQVCPTYAIQLEKRDGILSVSEVEALECIGCGNCVVVCPVKAITLPGWDDVEIPAQICAALQRPVEGIEFKDSPRIVVLACEWSAYAAADMAGKYRKQRSDHRLTFPPNLNIIPMNCSARFDPYHILWAFLNGADGVLLGACPPGECHYGTGNLYAQERVVVLQKALADRGVDPSRLKLAFFTVDDGEQFSEAVTDFAEELVRIPIDIKQRN
jgi:heterodisulfide reductase subunit A